MIPLIETVSEEQRKDSDIIFVSFSLVRFLLIKSWSFLVGFYFSKVDFVNLGGF